MTSHPILTDPVALGHHRRRARPDALFLHQAARAEAEDRLTDIARRFDRAGVVTPFPEVWAGFPAATIAPGPTLGLEPGSCDLVIHALDLHWADDPVGQLVQCRRALIPDGLFLGALFGGQTLHELRAVMAEVEVAVTGGLSPRVLPMGEIRDLGALLGRAGFALPVADSVVTTVEYADARSLMLDLRAMGEANALSERDRRIPPRALFSRLIQRYAEAFEAGQERVPATFEVIWLTGWAPSVDQPQPLRPGSAKARLADALGVPEIRPKD